MLVFFFFSLSNSADLCCFFSFLFFLVQFYLVSQEWGVSISYSNGAGGTLTGLLVFCSLIPCPGSGLTAVFSNNVCFAEQWR